MKLFDLLASKDCPLSEEQRKELLDERISEISELKQEIQSLQSKNKSLNEDMDNFALMCNDQCEQAKGALIAVKAMLNASCNATHRMRDFYAKAMIKYIDEIEKRLKKISKEDLFPF